MAIEPTKSLTTAQKFKLSREQPDELRARGAEIAVDMEEGRWLDAKGRPWSGAYSKAEIVRTMGWEQEAGRKKALAGQPHEVNYFPSWMQEPGFSNWVQFERIKRTATARMSLTEARPLVAVGAGGMLLELVKRVLTQPEAIGNRELFLETRKWVELLKGLESEEEQRQDATTIINNFFVSINRLPKEAREKAQAFFDADLARLTKAAKRPAIAAHAAKIT